MSPLWTAEPHSNKWKSTTYWVEGKIELNSRKLWNSGGNPSESWGIFYDSLHHAAWHDVLVKPKVPQVLDIFFVRMSTRKILKGIPLVVLERTVSIIERDGWKKVSTPEKPVQSPKFFLIQQLIFQGVTKVIVQLFVCLVGVEISVKVFSTLAAPEEPSILKHRCWGLQNINTYIIWTSFYLFF